MAPIKIFLAFIFLTLSSCEKKAVDPVINSVSATIDGKSWEKKACWGCIGAGSSLDVTYQDSLFKLTAEDGDRDIVLRFKILNVKSVGVYVLTSRDKNYARLTDGNTEEGPFYTNDQKNGKFIVTHLDLTKKTMSGTFEFEANNEYKPNLTVKVLNGKFHVKLD